MVSVRGGMLQAAPPHLQETVTCAQLQHPAGPSGWGRCVLHAYKCLHEYMWFKIKPRVQFLGSFLIAAVEENKDTGNGPFTKAH